MSNWIGNFCDGGIFVENVNKRFCSAYFAITQF